MTTFRTGVGGYLQNHAYNNVWCTPNQDKHAIFKPARLTKVSGVRNNITVMWRNHKLPDITSRYHVYQFGQVPPILLGLKTSTDNWIQVSQACNDISVMLDVYTSKGIQIPRHDVWYKFTKENNLIFAVKYQNKIKFNTDFDDEDVYFRIYRNAFYESSRADGVNDIIRVTGKLTQSTNDVLDLQNTFNLYKSYNKGLVYGFVNGRFVDRVDLINTEAGDNVEIIYDASIKEVFEIKISDLKNFVSTRDSVQKYLIHNPQRKTTIDFYDDIDIFIVKNVDGRSSGRYYNRNSVKSVRMLSHQDYSVPVADVASFGNLESSWNNVEDLSIRVHVRESGYIRPLIYEKNRILDLYRLSNTDLERAMVGIDSTVDEWSAAGLENSEYVKLMEANIGHITRESVQKTYGYNAISKLLSDTPIKTRKSSGVTVADIPIGMQEGCTVYEYDRNGFLTSWHYHAGSDIYATYDSQTDMVELIAGMASESLDIVRNTVSGSFDPKWNYRFYLKNTVVGQGV